MPNPHAYEVQRVYQDIHTTLLPDGSVEVYNERFFTPTDDLSMQWTLLRDGRPVRSGTVNGLSVAPQQRAKVTIPYGPADGDGEWLLNVAWVLNESTPMLQAGTVIARDQLRLSEPAVSMARLSDDPVTSLDRKAGFITVNGRDFSIAFNETDGLLSRYDVGGRPMLKDSCVISPNFWRAPTDNDYGANLQSRYSAWKRPGLSLTSLDARRTDNGNAEVKAVYRLRKVPATLTMTYTIDGRGAVRIDQDLTPDEGSKVVGNLGLRNHRRAFDHCRSDRSRPLQNQPPLNHGLVLRRMHRPPCPRLRQQLNRQRCSGRSLLNRLSADDVPSSCGRSGSYPLPCIADSIYQI